LFPETGMSAVQRSPCWGCPSVRFSQLVNR
jgi:hypothetical protein